MSDHLGGEVKKYALTAVVPLMRSCIGVGSDRQSIERQHEILFTKGILLRLCRRELIVVGGQDPGWFGLLWVTQRTINALGLPTATISLS